MKYHWVRQHSGEDCAAASLAIVAKHYGRCLRINYIRELVGTRQGGTTMLGLKYGAQALGFETKAIKASPDILDELHELTLPAILYWKGYHFVVFYGRKGRKFVISDPAMGIRYLTRQELLKDWQGYMMLLLEPDPQRFAAQAEDPTPINPFASLLHRLWQQRGILQILLPLNLGVGLLALATPLLLQFLTDQVLVEDNSQLLTLVAVGVMELTLVNSGLTWTQSNLVAAFAEKLQKELKLDFGKQVLHLPLSYHEARRSGTAIRRLADIQQINLLISQLVIELPIKTFIGLVAVSFIFVYSWQLGLVTVGLGIAMIFAALAFQPKIKQVTNRSFAVAGENAGVLSEAFNGALTLKTMAAAPQLWSEIQERSERESKYNLRAAKIHVSNQTVSEAIAGVGTVILLWFGSWLVFQDHLTIGRLIAIYGLKEGFLQFAIAFVKFISEWTEIKAITNLLAELFEYIPEHQGDAAKPWVHLSDTADIQLKNLTFYYPGRLKLLENLSVTIPGGQVIAFMGKSGCGKSTIAKLLTRLYPLQSGEIFIGDRALSDLPLDCLRQQVVLVPQDSFFLHRSIIDNFRLSVPNATIEEIIEACRVAGADEFICQFPQQYETILGVVGANISGGQKQRIAIARAILKNPPILILDESTANLDPVTEDEVLAQILNHRRGKTTILISHRPQVILRADWLVMLNQGQLQFNGKPEYFQAANSHFNKVMPNALTF
ncbi:ABC-type bacteriocin/lantibiotic exporter with N-terminal double-glycine peptidase domain [Nostoc sp. PCC 7524]|uniref:peptidase domain-containing ABC transporter n=1 Tax=Nostoc sp. (strain ATCC 29411 / PCC 7524) TaxID=28072 RepID=UPI00029ED085|nr:peptidase domain-containing ABC transporter [Nostoc sp. PCC 7524]AFY49493.1 ABC-type bacteriocin/lantibiotic exporter with N-terminal double-glycine peptidase domain [Nostoc sp. PCC 7524]